MEYEENYKLVEVTLDPVEMDCIMQALLLARGVSKGYEQNMAKAILMSELISKFATLNQGERR